jgi:hypothetical protein
VVALAELRADATVEVGLDVLQGREEDLHRASR